ncbi:hypothetical protein DPMN_094661 [Dreissena polymorpha]|uniref:Uncharacterized protein n=1 Tax=Dreissena polymorpha TaxID=45954 RepID=A0A9D4L7T7_DREPO|nr:hypothetical protein DPMN_094661 [Dreissena polymorpha]
MTMYLTNRSQCSVAPVAPWWLKVKPPPITMGKTASEILTLTSPYPGTKCKKNMLYQL